MNSTLFKAGIFKLYSKFYQLCKRETARSTAKYFIVSSFLLSGKSNYVVEEFSAERQGEAGSGDSLPILHRTQSDPTPRLETVQSHFQ